jgi:hypothetical protein
MNMMNMKNWKTTSAGISAIVGAITGGYISFKNHTLNEVTVPSYLTALLAGVGLVFARDATTTSVDMGLQGTTQDAQGQTVITPHPINDSTGQS